MASAERLLCSIVGMEIDHQCHGATQVLTALMGSTWQLPGLANTGQLLSSCLHYK